MAYAALLPDFLSLNFLEGECTDHYTQELTWLVSGTPFFVSVEFLLCFFLFTQ